MPGNRHISLENQTGRKIPGYVGPDITRTDLDPTNSPEITSKKTLKNLGEMSGTKTLCLPHGEMRIASGCESLVGGPI
jgi:hypothetical protein